MEEQARIVVSMQVPHQILMSSEGLYNILDWNPSEVAGRSMKFMTGPGTDTVKIQNAVKNAGFMKGSTVNTALYRRNNSGRAGRAGATSGRPTRTCGSSGPGARAA